MNRLPNWVKKSIVFLFQTVIGFYITSFLGGTLTFAVFYGIVAIYQQNLHYLIYVAPFLLGTNIITFIFYRHFKSKYSKLSKYEKIIFRYRMYWHPVSRLPYCPKCRAYMMISYLPKVPNFCCPSCRYVPSNFEDNPKHIHPHEIQEIMRKEGEQKHPGT